MLKYIRALEAQPTPSASAGAQKTYLQGVADGLDVAAEMVEWEKPIEKTVIAEYIAGMPRYETENEPNKAAAKRAKVIRDCQPEGFIESGRLQYPEITPSPVVPSATAEDAIKYREYWMREHDKAFDQLTAANKRAYEMAEALRLTVITAEGCMEKGGDWGRLESACRASNVLLKSHKTAAPATPPIEVAA